MKEILAHAPEILLLVAATYLALVVDEIGDIDEFFGFLFIGVRLDDGTRLNANVAFFR